MLTSGTEKHGKCGERAIFYQLFKRRERDSEERSREKMEGCG
jgi:hypothetical protein